MMLNPTIIHQKDQLLYPDVLFNRSINPKLKPIVLIVGGNKNKLTDLSSCFQISEITNVQTELIMPISLAKSSFIPPTRAYIELVKPSQINKSPLDEALTECNLLVLAPDLENNSTNQLACHYILENCTSPILLTDEVIKLASVNPKLFRKDNLTFVISTQGLLDLAKYIKIGVAIRPDRGVYNKIDIIRSVQEKIKNDFIVYDAEQILVCTSSIQIGLIEIPGADIYKNRGELLGLMAGLIAEHKGRTVNIFKTALTGGYIYKVALTNLGNGQSIASEIKQIMNEF